MFGHSLQLLKGVGEHLWPYSLNASWQSQLLAYLVHNMRKEKENRWV